MPDCHAHGNKPHWHYLDGGWNPLESFAPHRPLVVIDPEDRDQVERLLSRYLNEYDGMDSPARKDEVDCFQIALRSLVADPKPEEPQGLGAVIEESSGERLVRTSDENDRAWTDENGDSWPWRKLAVVRVLSEGLVA